MSSIEKNTFRILSILMFIGVIAAGIISFQRFQVEHRASTVEMVYDYNNIIESSFAEHKSANELFDLYRKSGITSLAVYDETIEKLSNRNLLKIIPEAVLSIQYPELPVDSGYVYIGQTADKESSAYLNETYEHLKILFPRDSVNKVNVNGRELVKVKSRQDVLMTMPLGVFTNTVKDAASYNFYVVIRPSNIPHLDKDQLHLFEKAVEASDKVSAVIFQGKEVYGYKDNIKEVGDYLKSKKIPFTLIEAQTQLGFEKQSGNLDLAKSMDYYTLRLYAMSKDELIKLDPQEAAARFYISDIERNIRMNLFPSYKFGIDGKTLSETNALYIKGVTNRLENHGFSVGKASIMEAYYPSTVLRSLTVLGAIALCLSVLFILLPVLKKYAFAIGVVGVMIPQALFVGLHSTLILQLLALGAAIGTPVLVINLFMNYCIRKKDTAFANISWFHLFTESIVILWAAGLLSLCGALFVSGLLGDIRFLLEIEIFRGVKATFVLPLLLVSIIYIQKFPFFGNTVTSDKDFVSFIQKFCHVQIKLGIMICLGLLAIVGYFFIGRSGNNGAPVPAFEIALRRFLENVMYARPREKEFFIGHPAILLSLYAMYNKWPQVLHYFLIIAVTIGQGSMVETFAHMRSPFLLSFIRGLDGLAVGTLVMIGALLGTMILSRITKFFGDRYGQL